MGDFCCKDINNNTQPKVNYSMWSIAIVPLLVHKETKQKKKKKRENLLHYIISSFGILGPNIIAFCFHLFTFKLLFIFLAIFLLFFYSKFHTYNFFYLFLVLFPLIT